MILMQVCRRRSAVVLLAVLLLGGVLLSGVAAAVPSTWVRVPSPHPSDTFDLRAVSCVSASFCIAIGDLGLFEQWNGTRWSVIPGLLEADAGVSCATTKFCVAVGEYYPSGGDARLVIDGWDGSTWSAVPAPTPGAINSLTGVSCASPSFCVAVGTYRHDTSSTIKTLAEMWNGTKWSVVDTPSPSTLQSFLGGVSCSGPSFCVAVGSSHRSNQIFPLIEHWNGTRWTTVASPRVRSVERDLVGVSCTSPTFCAAVGSYFKDSTTIEKGLAEIWDGHGWSLSTPIPNPLSAVSCVTATSCVAPGAVGEIQSWSGAGWSRTPSPRVGLFGVSCISTTACTAVGDANDAGGSRPVVVVGS